MVGNLNHGLGRVTIYKLDAECRVREGCGDVNLQLGGFGTRRGGRILGLGNSTVSAGKLTPCGRRVKVVLLIARRPKQRPRGQHAYLDGGQDRDGAKS